MLSRSRLQLTLVPLGLAACGAPAPVVEDTPTTQATTAPEIPEEKEEDGPVASGFVDIFDDSSIVTVQVPDTWTQIDGAPVTTSDGVQLYSVLAFPTWRASRRAGTRPVPPSGPPRT